MVTYLLAIDSSITGPDSVSRPLVAEFVEAWTAARDDRNVVYRDLAADPVPHLTTAGLHYPAPMRRAHETVDAEAEALQRRLIDEVAGAAAVVIGAPMYNYSVPSTLKAWLDYLHVLGTTIPAEGQTGVFHGIPVVVVSPRGLAYDNSDPAQAGDYTVPPIERILGESLGMNVTSIVVEHTLATRIPPLAAFESAAADSLDAARARLRELATTL